MTSLLLPAARAPRWCANFADRHGATSYAVAAGALTLDRPGRVDGLAAPALRRRRTRASPPPEALADAVDGAGRLGRPAGPQGRLRRGPAGGGDPRRAQDRPAPRPGPHQGRRPEPAALRPPPRQPGPGRLRGGRRPRRPHPRRPPASTPWSPAATREPSTRSWRTPGWPAPRRGVRRCGWPSATPSGPCSTRPSRTPSPSGSPSPTPERPASAADAWEKHPRPRRPACLCSRIVIVLSPRSRSDPVGVERVQPDRPDPGVRASSIAARNTRAGSAAIQRLTLVA